MTTVFRFGKRSMDHLQGVHVDLIKVAERALELSPIDFAITDGLRTKEEQEKLYLAKRTETMDSKHLIGLAVDVAPYVGGRYVFEWPFYYPVADAFIQASKEANVPIRWGGSWGADLWAVRTAQGAQEVYIMRKIEEAAARNEQPDFFFDGPHFELVPTEWVDTRAA